MKLFKTVGLACLSIVTTTAIATAAVGSSHWSLVRGDVNQTGYSCNDIVFSETVNNPGAYSDISDLSSKGVTNLDCSMTEWTNANYGSTMTDTAIKIGGSRTGKYSGSVKLTLNNGMTASRLIVYATGWKGDAGTQKLGVNGTYQDVGKTTNTYIFAPYTFDLGSQTDEIIFSNDNEATGSRRIVISKIVLRLHNEQTSGGDTPVDPIDPPSGNTVNFTLSSADSVVQNDITVTFDKGSGGTAPTWYSAGLRLYASNTVTVTCSSNIIAISFNWEKQGSKAFASATASVGNYTHPSAAGVGSWTGSATIVIFTLGGSGQLQLNTFSVTY